LKSLGLFVTTGTRIVRRGGFEQARGTEELPNLLTFC
jgi:hypothetical protein